MNKCKDCVHCTETLGLYLCHLHGVYVNLDYNCSDFWKRAFRVLEGEYDYLRKD